MLLSVGVVTQHPRTWECCCSYSASHPRILPCFHQEGCWQRLWNLGSVENEQWMNPPCLYICRMVSNNFFPTSWFLQIYYCAKVSSESYEITLYFKYYETYCNILHWKLFQIDYLSPYYREFFSFQDHLFGLCCLGCMNDLPIWLFISVSILLVTCSFISY